MVNDKLEEKNIANVSLSSAETEATTTTTTEPANEAQQQPTTTKVTRKTNQAENNKKREDLTSLGSDDSGEKFLPRKKNDLSSNGRIFRAFRHSLWF